MPSSNSVDSVDVMHADIIDIIIFIMTFRRIGTVVAGVVAGSGESGQHWRSDTGQKEQQEELTGGVGVPQNEQKELDVMCYNVRVWMMVKNHVAVPIVGQTKSQINIDRQHQEVQECQGGSPHGP